MKIEEIVKKIKGDVEKQLDSIDADIYRVTLINFVNDRRVVHGEFNTEELLSYDMLENLNYKNFFKNENIYITPYSLKWDYFLIDDVKNLNEIRDKYKVCSIVETSPNNFQIIIKTNKIDVDEDIKNAIFKKLNKEYGDPAITARIHPFRLAGYKNKKQKYNKNGVYPIVRNIFSNNQFCVALEEEILNFKIDKNNKKIIKVQKINNDKFEEIEMFVYKFYRSMEKQYGSAIDWSIADWMLLEKLIKKGFKIDKAIEILKEYSPGLNERHGKQTEQYLETTKRSFLKKNEIKKQQEVKL